MCTLNIIFFNNRQFFLPFVFFLQHLEGSTLRQSINRIELLGDLIQFAEISLLQSCKLLSSALVWVNKLVHRHYWSVIEWFLSSWRFFQRKLREAVFRDHHFLDGHVVLIQLQNLLKVKELSPLQLWQFHNLFLAFLSWCVTLSDRLIFRLQNCFKLLNVLP